MEASPNISFSNAIYILQTNIRPKKYFIDFANRLQIRMHQLHGAFAYSVREINFGTKLTNLGNPIEKYYRSETLVKTVLLFLLSALPIADIVLFEQRENKSSQMFFVFPV